MVGLREYKKMIAGLVISTFGLVGCGGVTFDTPIDEGVLTKGLGVDFPYQNKVDLFSQNELLDNTVTINYQVFNSNGLPLSRLTKSDFLVIENGQEVKNFTLSSKRDSTLKADIVFVLDKTASMSDEINGVKENVRDFVQQLKSVNIFANLCLVTFDDNVQDQCFDFHVDDPSTAQNENIDDFLDRLERVEVKGGNDDPENQLQGLMSAAVVTPWRPNAQRITIMITDESFSHTGSPGDAGSAAQSYTGTYNTLKDERITNYIVGPKIPGYSSPFQGTPALALPTNFFDITTLAENKGGFVFSPTLEEATTDKSEEATEQSLKEILRQIAASLTSEYTITYNINDNNLNPTLPVSSRSIDLQVSTVADANVVAKPITATFPDGHPVAKQEWTLTTAPEDINQTQVYFNNVIVNPALYAITNNKILFNNPPPYGITIKVVYDGGMSSSLQLRQLRLLNPNVDDHNVVVFYNDVRADGTHFEVLPDATGKYLLLSVKPAALEDERYRIRELGKLRVTFDIEKRNITVK